MGTGRGALALVGADGAAPALPGPVLLEEMLAGWRNQQLARRLTVRLVGERERVVRQFTDFTGCWPWQWAAAQAEEWLASGGWAHSTMRSYQGALALFLDYACDPRYGWVSECEQRVGAVPVQVFHERNSAVHVSEHEGRPERRPLTRGELQAFFDAADDHVERAASSGRKGWLASFRDATLFKVIYGWGLRRREAAMLDVADFAPNPAAPELGSLGVCHVRFGKAMRGSPPRRRAVATVMPWAAEALAQYLEDVRPWAASPSHPALWLTERGGRISPRSVDERFASWRGAAGLPGELSVHCLRHSYVSHLIEDGVDPLFVQQQAGHSWASTTATYTNPRELHQAGEKTPGQQVRGSPEQRPARPEHGPVSWEDPAVIPSGARSAHQGACIRRESQKRSEEGTRGFVAQVCVPGGAFSGFQYLTPPLTVGQDARNRMLRSALARAFGEDGR